MSEMPPLPLETRLLALHLVREWQLDKLRSQELDDLWDLEAVREPSTRLLLADGRYYHVSTRGSAWRKIVDVKKKASLCSWEVKFITVEVWDTGKQAVLITVFKWSVAPVVRMHAVAQICLSTKSRGLRPGE